jgi:hypothetical protein
MSAILQKYGVGVTELRDKYIANLVGLLRGLKLVGFALGFYAVLGGVAFGVFWLTNLILPTVAAIIVTGLVVILVLTLLWTLAGIYDDRRSRY